MDYGDEYNIKFFCAPGRSLECSTEFNWFTLPDQGTISIIPSNEIIASSPIYTEGVLVSKMAHSSLIYNDEEDIWHMIIDAKVGYLHMVRCEYTDDNSE